MKIQILKQPQELIEKELEVFYDTIKDNNKKEELSKEITNNIKNLLSDPALDNFFDNIQTPDYFTNFSYDNLAQLEEIS